MDINSINEVPEEQEIVQKFEWPEAYYLPTDGEKRIKALERAIKEGLEPEKNKIRKEICDRRYNGPVGVDRFLSGYMNLGYYATVVKSKFTMKFHKKDIKKTQEYLCYDIPDKYGQEGADMLFLELYHMIDYYIDICLRDKKYGGLILGLGTMKRENLVIKIANDLYRTCYGLPVGIEISDSHKLLVKAARQCFRNRFPEEKEVFDKITAKDE